MVDSSQPASDVSEASGGELTPEQLIAAYRAMLVTRALDLRAWTLSRQGKAHFVITGRGHEAAQVGSALALRPGRDWIVPYYRDLGLCTALGITARESMLNIFGKAADPYAGGRQLPMHFSSRALRIFSGSSVVATQIPHGAGLGLAVRLSGDDAVVATYFGEGATSKGDFHEAINFAAVQSLPVIFFCENNGYAISIPQRGQMVVESVASRGAAYGMPGMVVDGMDVIAVYETMREAVAHAQRHGPVLVEAKVYRMTPHSSDDDDRSYRSREEVAAWLERDPVPAFGKLLRQRGIIDAAQDDELQRSATIEVDEATDYAAACADPEPEDAVTRVFAMPPVGG